MTQRRRENARRRLDEDIHAAIAHAIAGEAADAITHGDQDAKARTLARSRDVLARRIVTELRRHFSITRRKP